jgi:hypothetical protein
MANNRVYLVHKYSNIKIALGKRMGGGYYGAPSAENINEFFDKVETWHQEHENAPWDMDGFALEFELAFGGKLQEQSK